MPNYKKEYPDGISQHFWDNFVVPNVKRIKGNKCLFCSETKNLDIHHLDYEEEVSINTLQLLCRSCHKLVHKNTNKEKKDDIKQ